jgi:hypothetical protein
MSSKLQSFLSTTILALFIFVRSYSLHGQTIAVRLINGETGKPMKNFNITFEWDQDSFKSSVVFIGAEGIGRVDVLRGATAFYLMSGPRIGKEPFRIAFLNCNHLSSKISIEEVIKVGVVPENVCGSRKLAPKPGEVVFWGRPRHFWEPDFQ